MAVWEGIYFVFQIGILCVWHFNFPNSSYRPCGTAFVCASNLTYLGYRFTCCYNPVLYLLSRGTAIYIYTYILQLLHYFGLLHIAVYIWGHTQLYHMYYSRCTAVSHTGVGVYRFSGYVDAKVGGGAVVRRPPSVFI